MNLLLCKVGRRCGIAWGRWAGARSRDVSSSVGVYVLLTPAAPDHAGQEPGRLGLSARTSATDHSSCGRESRKCLCPVTFDRHPVKHSQATRVVWIWSSLDRMLSSHPPCSELHDCSLACIRPRTAKLAAARGSQSHAWRLCGPGLQVRCVLVVECFSQRFTT